MEAYYQQQSVSPYFSGHYRQRGSGFGALAAGIGRAALPIARKFLWPVVKKIGRELIVQAAPELVEVVTKKSPKQALKSTVQKTVRKQVGGSKRIRKLKTNGENPKQGIRKKKPLTRCRSNFFSKVQNDLLPAEATHTTLDLFEKQPLLITFHNAFTQKVGPSYSPDGPMLEFEV